MRSFTDIPAFNGFLAGEFMQAFGERVLKREAERAGAMVAAESRRVLGTYDYGWPHLKPETIARKRMGDSPLLETGAMRKSIGYSVHPIRDGYVVIIGSTDPKAPHHEFGTAKIPPRPFLSSALMRKMPAITARLGRQSYAALTGAAR